MLKCTESHHVGVMHIMHHSLFYIIITLNCKLTLGYLEHWNLQIWNVEKQPQTLINTYYLHITVIHTVTLEH